MKKLLLAISILLTLLFTGCASSNDLQDTSNLSENQKIVVYCNDCGEECDNLSKFCSNCGVEAKWVTEKPDIVVTEEEATNEEESNNEKENVKEESIKKEEVKDQCGNCGKYFAVNKLHKFHAGLLCETCYNYPKTCEYGFYGICEGCEECTETNEMGSGSVESYQPNNYDLYDPEFSLEGMYTCTGCGRTTNVPIGTIGLCQECNN